MVVMAVYAPECNVSVVEVLREGRRGGAWDFHITVDFLTKMYGPCWQGYDKDPDRLKKSCGMGS